MRLDGEWRRRSVLVVSCVAAAVPAAAEPLPRFPAAAVWNQDISSAPTHPDSADMIAKLDELGGFGLDPSRMQIDFSLHVVRAPVGSPTRTIVAHSDGYYSPDCEPPGTAMPVPPGARIEGVEVANGLDCENGSNDCHLLVVQGDRLYEAYRATEASATEIEAQCLAIWELDFVYPPEGRGEHCTSADAAGFPMAPLMFNADDVAASLAGDATGGGDLGHAIRFILPNDHMASDVSLGGSNGVLYVRPASHAGGPDGPAESVPYGSRLRLRSDFPVSEYPAAARVILNTFMRYGIVLADGGNIALTAESDLYTTAKWDDESIDIGSRIFFDQIEDATPVAVTDFEVVDTGPRIPETYECVRSESFLETFRARSRPPQDGDAPARRAPGAEPVR